MEKRPWNAHLTITLLTKYEYNWVDNSSSGIICAYYPAAPELRPKHTVYSFSFIVKFVLYLSGEKNENKKEAEFGSFLN